METRKIVNRDSDTPLSFENDRLRVDWYNAGEGWNGDYNPEDPDDENLLRFDVYYNPHYPTLPSEDDWEVVEDASYCTQMPADTPIETLEKALSILFREYEAVIADYPDVSVKKLGERLSWISPAC